MNAQALICDEARHFAIRDVVLPDPADDQIAIRTLYSGVSIGTEFALIRGKLNWGPFPICTGYMGTGIVEAVGSGIADFAVGESVYFRGNDAMALAEGGAVSCVSGAHASHVVRRPHGSHGVGKLPPGAPHDAAAMFVLPAVGLNGVDMAGPRLGETVVVYGAGLIGLGVVAACAARGCTVIAVDIHEAPLALARSLGADFVINGRTQDVAAEVKAIATNGADIVFECTGIPACLDPAIALCRTQGKFVWQGNYGADPVSLHFLPPHGRRLQMFFPCDDGLAPCRNAVVKAMARGTLPWEMCITHRIGYESAPDVFARIDAGSDPSLFGVVIDWKGAR